MTIAITFASLNRRWPRASHDLVEGIVASSATALAKYEINTPLRLAHFLAQCSVECAAGTAMSENLNYTASRLVQVWPSRFPTIDKAQPFAHDPRLLADNVYGGRMGNVAGTDDGWNYRGRGLIDITGKAEYAKIGTEMGLGPLAVAAFAADPAHALEVACAYWKITGLDAYADKDMIVTESKVINGGLTGLADREAWLKVWKSELAEAPPCVAPHAA